MNSNYEVNHENMSYSGYYLFDSLWVKENGHWKYLLALFDLKLNTSVSKELVDSETVENIYSFLNRSLTNQEQKCIITDLKPEYRVAIDKLNIKQQFCKFHIKQLINREIKKSIDKNSYSDEEIELIYNYKSVMFEIINSNSMNSAIETRNKLYEVNNSFQELLKI